MSHATKKWEVFPGRNKFCFDGKIIMGPDVTIFYINIFLIVGTTLLFIIFECPYLTVKVSPFIPVITLLLFIFVMSTLLKTSFTDPGIIPRATADEALYTEKQIKITACGDVSADRPPPRTKEIFIRGQSVKLKYCFTCKIFRPPRASHCSLCDNCVDHFDHHCPWVGNCVGRRNYRYFYLFTVALSFYIAFVFICTCIHLYFLSENRVVVEAVKDSPASVIVLLVTFFSCWSVFGLAVFHTYLAASNQTTNEDIKGSFSNKRGGSSRNPYTSGNGCSNCCYVLCGPFSPSLIDREGFITPDLVEKNIINERQPTKMNTSTYVSSNTATVHYPWNGMKSYPVMNQSQKMQSSVIPGQQFNKQIFIEKSSPTSLDDGNLYSKRRPVMYEKVDEQTEQNSKLFQKKNQLEIDISKLDLDLDDIETPSSFVDNKNTLCLEPLSASKLKLLHDTTMIESALDLDSLEESTSSVGANSHAGLIKNKHMI
ncbi:hypothetical protein PGB90_008400 [Kerria lacca]